MKDCNPQLAKLAQKLHQHLATGNGLKAVVTAADMHVLSPNSHKKVLKALEQGHAADAPFKTKEKKRS